MNQIIIPREFGNVISFSANRTFYCPSFIKTAEIKYLETYKKIILYKFLYELNKCY